MYRVRDKMPLRMPLLCNAVEKLVTIVKDPYEAMAQAHAVVVLTEWDEFKGQWEYGVRLRVNGRGE